MPSHLREFLLSDPSILGRFASDDDRPRDTTRAPDPLRQEEIAPPEGFRPSQGPDCLAGGPTPGGDREGECAAAEAAPAGIRWRWKEAEAVVRGAEHRRHRWDAASISFPAKGFDRRSPAVLVGLK